MKLLIVAVVAAIALGAADGHAQATSNAGATSGSMSGAGATAGAAVLANIVVPGSGAAASAAASSLGTLANPQWVMGQSTIGPSVTSYDACSRSRSGSAGPIGLGWTQTDDDCARQRQAEFARQMGIPAVAYEQMCKITEFADSDAKTIRQCYAIKVADAKAGQPQPAAVPAAAAPIVVSTNTTAATAKTYPRCNPRQGIVDNCISN